jgi:hypothetical protein
MPSGREDEARTFYMDVLEMTEIPKPPELAKRGGVWFSSGNVQIHMGVEVDFRPAKKAHPAFRTTLYEDVKSRLIQHKIEVTEDHAIPGTRRFYIHDCFGNRLEVIGV